MDPANAEHAHIAERLDTAWIAWLATTRRDGSPQAVPVWFGWCDPVAIVFTAPGTAMRRSHA